MMEDKQFREHFDTGLSKIRHEIKSRLVTQGHFGSINFVDIAPADPVPSGSTVEIAVNGRTVARSFSRDEVQGCRLRVGGTVLLGVVSMVDEFST